MNSEVHLSVHPNCHYQMTYKKLNLKIDGDYIRKEVEQFLLEKHSEVSI